MRRLLVAGIKPSETKSKISLDPTFRLTITSPWRRRSRDFRMRTAAADGTDTAEARFIGKSHPSAHAPNKFFVGAYSRRLLVEAPSRDNRVRADKDALRRALIELIEQAIALRVTLTTTTSEGTRFAPSCATVGPSVNEGDQDALLSPKIGTSAEPGEVLNATAAAAEIVEDHPPGLQPRDERNRPFEIDPVEFWEPRLALYRRRKMWAPEWGPRPDQDGCQAPAWLLEATGMWPSGLA